MKWIKASEFLPKTTKPVNAKHNGQPCTMQVDNYVQIFGKGFAHSFTLRSPNLGSIEWLDESPAVQDGMNPQTRTVDEIIESLTGVHHPKFYNCLVAAMEEYKNQPAPPKD